MTTRSRWWLVLAAVALLGGGVMAAEAEAEKPALPRLIEVGAKSCLACQQMAPIIDALKVELAGRIDVEFLDVSVTENLARAQTLCVQTIPTQIYLAADGKELWRHEGFMAKADILAKWRELGHDVGRPNEARERPR